VEAGLLLRIPAIPAGVSPPNKEVWWVKLAEKGSLNEALDFLRAYPETAPSARLIPWWNPSAGTRFALVLKQLFATSEAAQAQLRQLPGGMAATSQVLSTWGEKNIFFADPYLVNK
jgi:hypothetical protein